MKEYSDSEIVNCLKNRQGFVVHYLSHRYMPAIRLLVFKQGGDADDASDIFQEALLIMLEKIDKGQLELKCKFSTYLYCVCENLSRDMFRKRKAAERYIDQAYPDVESDQSESMDVRMLEGIFSEVYENLPHTHKEVLALHWQNVPNEEIANRLGLAYGYVKKIKSEAQAKLTDRVKEHPEYKQILSSDNALKTVIR